jgi:hypothetical protein
MDETTAQFWQAILIVLIQTLVPVLMGIALAWLKPRLKMLDEKIAAEMGQAQWEFTKSLVEQFVAAAEQQGLVDQALATGEQKKDWVIARLQAYSNTNGVTIDWAAVTEALEGAVWNAINSTDEAKRNGNRNKE